ncbi:MAG: amidase [Novosphingobium sp.]|jgi:amidase|nr:amidase [Novosphingobium sp.]
MTAMSHTAILVRAFPPSPGKVPVAVKDCLDMAGEVTTSGSRALAGAEPAIEDAEVVRRLTAAGCAIAGRANMHELAYGVTGLNSWTGTPINPRYPQLMPGGSSSGSAVAVAAGLVDFAIGTDTGGSIRVPATCCAVVGLKPSFGRVSRKGAHPAVSSLDCVGPFARDVAAIERAMAIIAPDWNPVAASPTEPRVAWFSPDGEAAILAHVRAQAAACFSLVDIDLPLFNQASDAGLTIIGRETWNACGHLTETGLVGRDVHDRLLMSAKITDAQLADAEAVRQSFAAAVDTLLEIFDAIALPAMTHSVPSLLEIASTAAPKPITLACRPFNLSGHPAIALPVGEVDGRPVSLQLVGRRGEDEKLCALARQVPIFSKGEA